jgi:acetyl-CoA C-acetyltransferase
MPKRVAIVGIGQTKHEESKGHYVYHEADFEASKLALDDASLSRGDLDTVIASGWDAIDGRTISDMHTCMSIGGYLKDSSHAAEDGIMALVYAYLRIVSGLFDVALVAGHGHREANIDAVTRITLDPLFTRPSQRNYIVTMAMQANAYMHKHGVSKEQAAKVVVKNRANGARNPYAHLDSPVTLEDVLASQPVAYPLKALDCPPESVGGVALILAAEDIVRRITDKPVWIRGLGWAIESYEMGGKDLAEIPSLSAAAQRAYKMAGIRRPLNELDLAEIHEATSFHELMDYEALGFAKPGQGAKLIDEGTTEMDGKLPVNPSGGSLCTNLFGGSGLVRAAEAALQLRGDAHGRQVADASLALAHGLSAPAGAAAPTNCVAILERG